MASLARLAEVDAVAAAVAIAEYAVGSVASMFEKVSFNGMSKSAAKGSVTFWTVKYRTVDSLRGASLVPAGWSAAP